MCIRDRLRASQLNGCAFCVDMHVKEAKIHGDRELRLHHVAVWRESPLFSEQERAALEWTEALTQLTPHGVSDAIYASVREQFSEQELSDLTFLVVAINGWNRLNVCLLYTSLLLRTAGSVARRMRSGGTTGAQGAPYDRAVRRVDDAVLIHPGFRGG